MNVLKLILLGNLTATGFMAGLIWCVQVVLYPIFAKAKDADFAAFHNFHVSSISLVVIPPMLAELALAALLVFHAGGKLAQWEALLAALPVALVWGVTFLVSVPLHDQLAKGYDEAVIARLVGTNWWRTLLWSVRMGWLLWLAYKVL